ncbi:MAG: MotA/TolQ/ExbB proton channel family protein [Planctomycetales bacterium]|nr:MotA/TolQ/ExbB proton channel family protein [Planctomycetales bacterium]
MFIRRAWTPPVIVFFSYWSLLILFFKRAKLRLQRRALQLRIMPEQMDFVLSVDRVTEVLHRLYEVCDDPRRFVLLHRIEVGLSNARNLSRVVDLGEILRTQSEHDESVMETSFNLIRGLVWAIPILGFIGTVSGLSVAIGGFGKVLSQTEDPSKLIGALQGVTGGLATAFETTLLALIAALLVQMAMTFQKKQEEEFLDECTEFCQREVLSRIAHSEPGNDALQPVPKPRPAIKPTAKQQESSPKRPIKSKDKPTPNPSADKPGKTQATVAVDNDQIVEAEIIDDDDVTGEVITIDVSSLPE